MGKVPNFGYWELRISWLVIFGIGAAILIPAYNFYTRINNPTPESYNLYAYHIDYQGYYMPVRLSRSVQGAEQASKFYSIDTTGKIYGPNLHPLIIPGTKVGIVKISPDSCCIKVKVESVQRKGYNIESGFGWLPKDLVHENLDSSRLADKYEIPFRESSY
ncbi:hypothetical protein [Ekhidna sp.]|uniref:hypothetical protein n=1 Tax=Ekhidna sp. TaxID=2608089 RepID=UPI003B5A71A6